MVTNSFKDTWLLNACVAEAPFCQIKDNLLLNEVLKIITLGSEDIRECDYFGVRVKRCGQGLILQHLGTPGTSCTLKSASGEGPWRKVLCTTPFGEISPYRHSTILSTVLRAWATEIAQRPPKIRYRINSPFNTSGFTYLFLETFITGLLLNCYP